MPKTVLTTGDVARHCHVSSETVNNWIRTGKLDAYSTPGNHRRIQLDDFATFLELHDMPPYELAFSSPQSGIDHDGHRLLVVDDDNSTVNLIVKYWSGNTRFELATASDGYEAGAEMIRFAPDLVLLDLFMPGVDGFEVCRKIKSDPLTRDTVVVVMTGLPDEENLSRALECGADRCVAKPFQLVELAATVDELLEQSTDADSGD